jgi:hypothetical protein
MIVRVVRHPTNGGQLEPFLQRGVWLAQSLQSMGGKAPKSRENVAS